MCCLDKKVKKTEEEYRKLGDKDRAFDICFWQAQGDRAIFEAASGMLKDFFLMRGTNADEYRLQRSVEAFRKL